jgi:hypothetical protein
MNLNPPPNPSVFPSRQQVSAALERAVQRARIIAEQTGTKLIVVTPPAKPFSPEQKNLVTESRPLLAGVIHLNV